MLIKASLIQNLKAKFGSKLDSGANHTAMLNDLFERFFAKKTPNSEGKTKSQGGGQAQHGIGVVVNLARLQHQMLQMHMPYY